MTANEVDATYQWIDCNDNNAIIEGETDRSFSTTKIGSYSVIITKNGCSTISECVSITSTENNNLNTQLILYPNPFKDVINIEFGRFISNGNLSIVDIKGREIKEIKIENLDNINFNFDVEPGLYFINITDNNHHAQMKIQKN